MLCVFNWCVESMLSKAAVDKSELEAEMNKSRSERANLQAKLHQMKAVSDGLSQDKNELNKIVSQVHHCLTFHISMPSYRQTAVGL